MKASRKASALLAEWASNVRTSDIPDKVRAVARTCVTDTIGVAMAGTASPVSSLARQVALENEGPGWADVLGAGTKCSASAAAFCNGVAAHALDFDDNCYAGFVHGSAIIVPAALAVAQERDLTGADLVTAIVVGAECEYAVGAAAGVDLYEKGWWTTGLLGPIGAGVAVGRLLGLDVEAMQSCIGFAVAGAGGTKACFGTDAKALMAGAASEAGVKWALLASRGANGPVDAFSHVAGFANLFNNSIFNVEEVARLGTDWRLVEPGIDIKKYPVCLSSHAAIDVVSGIVRREGIAAADIQEIVCDVPPVVVANLIYVSPETVREAQFSMEFAVAAAACFGELGLDQLKPEILHSEEVRALMARVRMLSGPDWDLPRRIAAPEGASILLTLKDGRQFSGFCSHAPGTAANPLPAEEIETKFLGCTQTVLGARPARDLLQALNLLDADVPVRDLLKPVFPGAQKCG
ncbi:MmgE/PrpD family protein [Nitratireductor indicus]|uniref:MmgE/PrpD family protein n=1 Tax=Nitratireductor indicus TaxID=721133 RepID=UPI002874E3E0|nr:MmgE/PrpD family protein [Nitratireductor indicus]MDS1137458.1 MmgE/PrpD family protein [Nitratireductor indicus]